jgi:transcriptional regulator with XRE-family HTH domain
MEKKRGSFVNYLKQIRFNKRLTQFELAILTGVHQSRISLFENSWAEPRPDEREGLAKAMGVKPGEIWPNKETPYTNLTTNIE